MFKNLTIYTLPPGWLFDEDESAQEQFEIDFALMAGTYQYIVDALVSEFGGIEGRE